MNRRFQQRSAWILLGVGVAAFLAVRFARAPLPSPARVAPTATRAVFPTPPVVTPISGAVPPVVAPASRLSRFTAEPGRHLVFAFQLDTQSKLDFQSPTNSPDAAWQQRDSIPEAFSVALVGELDVTVVRREATEFVLRVLLPKARLSTPAGAPEAKLDVDTMGRKPVFVRFSAQGNALAFAFDPELTPDAQRLAVSVFALGHQFVLRDANDAWEIGALHDDVGELTARFHWSTGQLLPGEAGNEVLHRKLLRYDQLPSRGAFGIQTTIQASQGEASFHDGWIGDAESRESRRGEVGGILTVEQDLRLSMHRVREDLVPIDDSVQPPTDTKWLSGPPAENKTKTPKHDTSKSNNAVDANPLGSMAELLKQLAELASLGKLDQREAYDVWETLSKLLTRHPSELLPKLEQMLADGDLDDDTARFAVTAVGHAGGSGSVEAAQLLARFIAEGPRPELRLWSVFAAHELQAYSEPVMAPVAEILTANDAPADLKTAAALLNGTILSVDGLPSKVEEKALETLGNTKDYAFTNGQPALYFEALGNSARPELIDDALRYLDDDNDEIKRAAIEAVRAIAATDEGRVALVREAVGDASASVRGAAIDGLGFLPPSESIARTLREIATSNADDSIRAHSLLALGRQAQQGEESARAALVQLQSDGNGDIRTIASEIVKNLPEPK